MRQRSIQSRTRRGFTLIELIATIVVLTILGSIVSSIIFAASDGYLQASTRSQLHQSASLTLDRVTRELREIPIEDTPGEIALSIDEITPSSIQWSGNRRVYLNGSTIILEDGEHDAATLATSVSSFSIRAFDAQNQMLAAELSGAACDAVRRLEVTLTLSRHGVSETIRSRVFIRATMRDEANS